MATDDYTGPDPWVSAPDDFDDDHMDDYAVVDGVVVRDVRAAAKRLRKTAVDAITVTTTAGHIFDGDEESQTRMARAVLVLQATGIQSVPWVLHDNSVISATAAEITEALALAGQSQAALWII